MEVCAALIVGVRARMAMVFLEWVDEVMKLVKFYFFSEIKLS